MVDRKYRMYGLVPYQLTGMQGGIQFMHAAIEYSNEFSDTSAYWRWSRYDKTVIVLNGGTTNTNQYMQGTLNLHLTTLLQNNIKLAKFYEPDLGDQMTAIVFLVDDRVWDKEAYPDLVPLKFHKGYEPEDLTEYREVEFNEWKKQFGDDADSIVFLRTFLKQFRFA